MDPSLRWAWCPLSCSQYLVPGSPGSKPHIVSVRQLPRLHINITFQPPEQKNGKMWVSLNHKMKQKCYLRRKITALTEILKCWQIYLSILNLIYLTMPNAETIVIFGTSCFLCPLPTSAGSTSLISHWPRSACVSLFVKSRILWFPLIWMTQQVSPKQKQFTQKYANMQTSLDFDKYTIFIQGPYFSYALWVGRFVLAASVPDLAYPNI